MLGNALYWTSQEAYENSETYAFDISLDNSGGALMVSALKTNGDIRVRAVIAF